MSILNELYSKSLVENERNIRFWENYIQSLQALDFSVYEEKLTVPALVPIGNRIFFRGELIHTNEVTVALGADYFTKCSLKQAKILRQHRINNAQSKLNIYKQERSYIENQVSFKRTVDGEGKEILEIHTEEEDKRWREKHRERMREYKKNQSKEEVTEISDEELWNRLEELELQEELENELQGMQKQQDKGKSFVVKEEDLLFKNKTANETSKEIENNNSIKINNAGTNQPSKLDLLEKVIEKQSELEEKLTELKNKERARSKTEQDLINKLAEMELLDELEDEMDRLDDVLETEVNLDSDDDTSTSSLTRLKKGVIFADEDDSETLEITFKHSDVEPCNQPYNPVKGIQKPSDIYQAHSNIFNETTSILKKTKYKDDLAIVNDIAGVKTPNKPNKSVRIQAPQAEEPNNTIVINDVVEKKTVNDIKTEKEGRPVSLFKKKRQQRRH